MNSKRKIEINIVEVQTYKILIQINSNMNHLQKLICKNIKSYALQCVQNDTI